MFNPVRMARVEAVLLKKDARAALRGLGGEEAVELTDTAPGPETAPSAPADNSRALAACSALLARLDVLRRELGAPAHAPAPGPEPDYAAAAACIEEWELRAAAPLKLRRELAAAAARLSEESGRLAVYAGLPLPPDGSGKFNYLYCAAGSVPAGSLRPLCAKIAGDDLAGLARLAARLAEELDGLTKTAAGREGA